MKSEKQVHAEFAAYLNKLEVPFLHSRTDQRTTTTVGDPDFCVCFMGRCLFLEGKVGKNKLSPAQQARIAYLKKSGNRVVVFRTVEQAIEAVKDILCEGKPEALLEPRTEAVGQQHEHDWSGLKQTIQAVVQKAPKRKEPKQPELPANGSDSFRIGNWQGTNYVMARKQDGSYDMIRPASQLDLLNMAKL